MASTWTRSYRTEWKLVPINPKTWTGTESVPGLKSFKVSTNGDGEAPTLLSGSMTVDIDPSETLDFGWYQLLVTLVSGATSTISFPLATMLFESDGVTYDYGVGRVSLKGQSPLKPCADRHMQDGEFIPKGADGAEWCRDALARHTPAPVEVEGKHFTVDRYYVFDSGTSYLKAVWNVLDSARWVIRVTGDGVIHICPKPKITNPSVIFEGDSLGLMLPGIDKTEDVSDVPNMYYARLGNAAYTAVNDDPESRVSTKARSYVKDEVDVDPIPIDGESIEHYAKRKLEELSTVVRTYSYTREIWEEVCPFDVVRVNVPGIYTGNARVISQSFTCNEKGGLQVEETIGEEVRLWTME